MFLSTKFSKLPAYRWQIFLHDDDRKTERGRKINRKRESYKLPTNRYRRNGQLQNLKKVEKVIYDLAARRAKPRRSLSPYYLFVFVSRGYEKQSILEIHAWSRQRKGISFLETLCVTSVAFIIQRHINTRGIAKKGKDRVVGRWSRAVGEIFLSSTFAVCWWRLSSARGTVENQQPRWIKLPTLLSERKRMPLIKFLDTGARRNAPRRTAPRLRKLVNFTEVSSMLRRAAPWGGHTEEVLTQRTGKKPRRKRRRYDRLRGNASTYRRKIYDAFKSSVADTPALNNDVEDRSYDRAINVSRFRVWRNDRICAQIDDNRCRINSC